MLFLSIGEKQYSIYSSEVINLFSLRHYNPIIIVCTVNSNITFKTIRNVKCDRCTCSSEITDYLIIQEHIPYCDPQMGGSVFHCVLLSKQI